MGIYVEQLRVYPLKSGKALKKEFAHVTDLGFEHDRLAMLVHADGPLKGTFISQRTNGFEKLARLHVDTSYADARGALGSRLHYHFNWHPANRFLSVPVPRGAESQSLTVWGNDCHGLDGGEEAAEFFTEELGTPARLMFYDRNAPRPADPVYSLEGDITSFADGYPFLIATRPSLQALRDCLPDDMKDKIGIDRFRPNIVLDGNLPFEEDVMHRIRIGKEVELDIVKPCSRCVMTTIDQETGERSPNEPIDTLTAVRLGKAKGQKPGVFFGQNAIPRKLGTINVGDAVEILSVREIPPILAGLKLGYNKPLDPGGPSMV